MMLKDLAPQILRKSSVCTGEHRLGDEFLPNLLSHTDSNRKLDLRIIPGMITSTRCSPCWTDC